MARSCSCAKGIASSRTARGIAGAMRWLSLVSWRSFPSAASRAPHKVFFGHHGVMKLPTQKLKGLRVRDFMASRIVTFSPEMPISEAVGILVQHRYSGAPVVDAKGRLVGVLSEKDCLRVAVLGTADGATEPLVRDYMTTGVETVEPDTDLLDVAEGFMQAAFRRFPVVEEGGRLVGQISRIDVLRAIDQLLRDEPK